MAKLTHVSISIELFRLPLRGCYEMAVVGLMHSFKGKGLMMSNGRLATTFNTDKRTIERAISRLKAKGIIHDFGTGKNDRCLVLTPDTMSVLDTDMMPVDDPTLGGIPRPRLPVHSTPSLTQKIYSKFQKKGQQA